MKGNSIWIALCSIFVVTAIIFASLSVMNLSSGKKLSTATVSEYEMSGDVQLNALSAELDGIQTKDYKNTDYPEGILENLKKAYSINNHLAGWLSIPGTELDTAVVQWTDNSHYLTKDFYERSTGETSSTNYGNIYLDYRCRTDGVLSKNMVIHGHTTGRSTGIPKQSFRSLYDYKTKENFIENPIIKYSTLYETFTYKICAVFLSTTEESADNGYFFNYIYPDMSESNMVGYIEQVNQRKLYETGVSLEPTDTILTLSTCTYDYGKNVDTRLVVVARLLHDGEDESIDTSLVKDNPDYRRPQIWYNSKGKTNPYKDSEKWKPSAE